MRRMGVLAAGIASATTGIVMIAACEDSGSSSGGATVDSSSPSFDSSVVPTDSSRPPVDSSVPIDAALAACNLLDAGVDASGFDASALVCPAGQWRDFAASTCKACPSAQTTCATITRGELDAGEAGSPDWILNFSAAQQKITTTVAPGTAQIVYATATADVGTCFSANGTPSNTVDVPVSINGNELVSTFPSQPVDGSFSTLTPCGTLTYTLVDACCNQNVVKVRLVVNQESTNTILARSCDLDGG
jgi:hypothetical protein